ncbi:MAG: transglutaminase domain-containing protein [Bacteroidales bacterium]|nr:transglutaminase domain-containing protein [Bacteroidales bacterium]
MNNSCKITSILVMCITMLSASCLKKVPVNDLNTLTDFEIRKNQLEVYFPDYFTALDDQSLTNQEKEYLEHLFAYMPISDFTNYEFSFWLQHVRASITARETFAWADSIPESIFLSYVLPPRVNNENLDTARMVFLKEFQKLLADNNLNVEQAVLEINHWCNSKVIYCGTDERTISPLAAIRSGFGRCGEESTFAVTALRAAGIPTRQVYTPRWVHTDDNHAWVEVWINNKWHYLGACEPAPVLNTGWFDVPATRTMLVHTKQFGKADVNNPSLLNQNENFTWVNALSTYAPVKKIEVRVINENNIPLWGVKVKYQIYNYAEMYPLYETQTNIRGESEFTTGYGSLEIYVSDGVNNSSVVVDPYFEGLVTVVLGKKDNFPVKTAKYIPPVAQNVTIIDDKLVAKTEKRIKQNELIRKNYAKSFYDESGAKHFAETFNFSEEIIPYLVNSRGNWLEIENFLIEAAYLNKQDLATKILEVISEKDLRDINTKTLSENLLFAPENVDKSIPDDIYYSYTINPRVEFEMLKPYRKFILQSFDIQQISDFKADPQKIIDWIRKNIATKIDTNNKSILIDELNNYNVAITPCAVHKFKLSDNRSLKIYFVAFCRSLGIPAKIDNVSGVTQYYFNNNWYDAILQKTQNDKSIKRGQVFFVNNDTSISLKYRINFSLARYEKAEFKTIDLGWETPISDFKNGINIPIGKYMLLTSVRNGDGSVEVLRNYFDIVENDIVYLQVSLPVLTNNLQSDIDFINGNILGQAGNTFNTKPFLKTADNCAFIWLEPGSEPSKHIMQDIVPMLDMLSKQSINVYFIIDIPSFKPDNYSYSKDLNYLYDHGHNLLSKNTSCKSTEQRNDFPVVILVNRHGKIIYKSEGYIIGIGDILLQKTK